MEWDEKIPLGRQDLQDVQDMKNKKNLVNLVDPVEKGPVLFVPDAQLIWKFS